MISSPLVHSATRWAIRGASRLKRSRELKSWKHMPTPPDHDAKHEISESSFGNLHVKQFDPIRGSAIRTISSTVLAWNTPRRFVEAQGRRNFFGCIRAGLTSLGLVTPPQLESCPLLHTDESGEVANICSIVAFTAMEEIERRLFPWLIVTLFRQTVRKLETTVWVFSLR